MGSNLAEKLKQGYKKCTLADIANLLLIKVAPQKCSQAWVPFSNSLSLKDFKVVCIRSAIISH